jgi:hypothetical protein
VTSAQLTQISEEAIKKAQEILKAGPNEEVRKDLTSASGAAAYDLQPVAILLQPVITPLRNTIPRVQNKRGGTSSEWRVISSLVNSGVFDPTVSTEGAPAIASVTRSRRRRRRSPSSPGRPRDVGGGRRAMGFEGDLQGARGHQHALRADDRGRDPDPVRSHQRPRLRHRADRRAATPLAAPIGAGTYNVKVRAIVGTGDGTNTRGKSSVRRNRDVGFDRCAQQLVIKATTPWVEGAIGTSGMSTTAPVARIPTRRRPASTASR